MEELIKQVQPAGKQRYGKIRCNGQYGGVSATLRSDSNIMLLAIVEHCVI